MMVNARALAVGIAYFTRDFEAAARAASGSRRASTAASRPAQRVLVRAGEGWAARMRSDADAGRGLLVATARSTRCPGWPPAWRTRPARGGAGRCRCSRRSPLAASRAWSAPTPPWHAPGGAGRRRLPRREEFAAIGALRYAVEAASGAAAAFLAAGRQDSARRAAPAPGSAPARAGRRFRRIDGLDSTAVELTRREAQLVDLAAQGLGNAEIADRLVLSVRTVETHLYRAMQKLGVRDRRELAERRG